MRYDRHATAWHEAGHVGAMVMSGRLPRAVSADWPQPEIAGSTRPDLTDFSPTTAIDLMLAVVMGPLADGTPDWPPAWPIDPATAPATAVSDARALRALADFTGCTEGRWLALVARARDLSDSREFRRLVDLIARALVLKDTLLADDLRWLIGEETLLKYGHKETEHAA